jgi:hypothetical protein
MARERQKQLGLETDSSPESTHREMNRHTFLLKRAEQTVLKAEASADEIRENARRGSEAEAAAITASYMEPAESEAREIVESAQLRSEILIAEAKGIAHEEYEKILREAKATSERMLIEAQSESERLLSEAQSESEKMRSEGASRNDEILRIQTGGREIFDRAKRQELGIIAASQSRIAGIESTARLNAEFIIRETTQRFAQEIEYELQASQKKLLSGAEEIAKQILGAEPEEEDQPVPRKRNVDQTDASV